MSVVQTVSDRGGLAQVAIADSDGYYYLQFGAVRLYTGSGDPNAIITAPKGSLYNRVDAGNVTIYNNTDAGTTWATLGSQS